MANFLSWNCHHQEPDICFLLSLLISVFLLLITSNASAAPLSFNFPSFDSNHPQIYTENSATVSSQGIELTLNMNDKGQNGSVGRATYFKPLHLWDKASKKLTNFTTHFSFIIDSQGNSNYGDGLAFFLAPNGSTVPPNVKAGGGLGLAINDNVSHALNYSENNFVAVEFDTYENALWDPEFSIDHVGINVRSMKSVETVPWLSGVMKGSTNNAWITYDSSQKMLNVTFTQVDVFSSTTVRDHVSVVVDMADHLPEWVTFGFSASTGSSYEIHRITSWRFDSSSEIVDEISTVPAHDPGAPIVEPVPTDISKGSRNRRTGLLAGLSVGCALIVVGVSFASYHLRRRRRKEVKTFDPVLDVSLGDDFRNGTGPRNFTYNQLASATNYFSEGEKLGEGGFGAVYRGFLKELNSYVAVKRISRGSKQGIKEYEAEVKIISRMRHRNLVKLIGWCHEKQLLLAYEFMPNGSLDSHLLKDKTLLSWEVRYRIAQGLASALLYLHEEGDQCVLHRDIKPSNIMLDSDFNAKLGDFGLARLVDHAKESQTTVLAGTMGYMAPECFTSCKASKKSDIYSFGVVALEIACGRRAVEPRLKEQEDQIRIAEWVWKLYGMGKILEAADPKLYGDFDKQEMERLMIVGLWCVHPDLTVRPSTRQVINVLLTSEAPLPILPPEMPVPAYLAPPMTLPTS